jgi:hypothetical protein
MNPNCALARQAQMRPLTTTGAAGAVAAAADATAHRPK